MIVLILNCYKDASTFFIDTESTVSAVKALLSADDPMVVDFIKYRRLLKKDRYFQTSYDTALAKVQIAISKKHRELLKEKNTQTKHLINIAQKLLIHWNMYYF